LVQRTPEAQLTADTRGRPYRLAVSRERLLDLGFVAPMLVVLGAFFFLPLVNGTVLSLHETQGFDAVRFIGLDNYILAIRDGVFHTALANTAVFTIAAIVFQTGIGLLLAVMIAEVRRGRTFFRLVFFAPFVLASVAVAAVWKFIYAPFFGVFATIADVFGIGEPTFAPLSDADLALGAILVAFLWRFVGFNMVVYLAAIQNLPRDLYEVALLEGANRWQQFRKITWPLLWPQTFTLVLLTTIGTLRIFDMMWLMTQGGPSHATETVATYLYSNAFKFFRVGYAESMAIILLIIIAVLTAVEYFVLNRQAEKVSG
jgi:ABC-type sugar transport system permease subunit